LLSPFDTRDGTKDIDPSTFGGANLADLWVDFLLKETDEAKKQAMVSSDRIKHAPVVVRTPSTPEPQLTPSKRTPSSSFLAPSSPLSPNAAAASQLPTTSTTVSGMGSREYQQTLPKPVRSAQIDRIQQQYGIAPSAAAGTVKYSSAQFLRPRGSSATASVTPPPPTFAFAPPSFPMPTTPTFKTTAAASTAIAPTIPAATPIATNSVDPAATTVAPAPAATTPAADSPIPAATTVHSAVQ
jgi:hypothetical protein